MEDAPAQKKSGRRSKSRKVLILVLMEDAPALKITTPVWNIEGCLNPCFNGRCTRTSGVVSKKQT